MRRKNYLEDATLPVRTRGWLDEIRQNVAPRPQLRIERERCALLVVDMLRYFAHPEGRCFLPAAEPIVGSIQRLLEAWRAAGAAVIFTRHCHRDESDLGMLGRFFSDYIRCGEPDSELIPSLKPRLDEPVLRKTTYDAFLGTPLEMLLRDHCVEQILITGVLTHMCCETSARTAFCRGFEVYVAADAVASSNEERHFNSLMSMADSVAVVMSTDEVLEQCNASKS